MKHRPAFRRVLVVLGATLLVGSSAFADGSGEDVYKRRCASCHATDGHGNEKKAQTLKIDAKLLDLGREEAKKPREELREILLKGKDEMPAFQRKLKPPEVDPVLDYAMDLAKSVRDKK